MVSAKTQHNNILLAVLGFACVALVVALIGYFTIGHTPEVIQGQVEVSEYRVSSKLAGRILELRVKEGDYVHKGDTLAILEVPEVEAQTKATEATSQAAAAISDMADNGARKETIQAAYQLVQQSQAALEITKKTYDRMQNLYNEGVVSAQKRDEAFAAYKATEAQLKAAKSQYDMARNGAREEERRAASMQAQAAKSAADVVKALLRESVQVAQVDGEVADIYPKVGELLGLGSPIMSISMMDDLWGTFNIREDQLKGLKVGDEITALVPAFNKNIKMKVFYIKDEGHYAVWKATKASGQYDLKTFEVKARPVDKFEGLRPGMSLIFKE